MNRKINAYAQSDVGRQRTENEDNYVWIQPLWNKPSTILLGAIDGVGGYEGGAEAALIAKNTIENYLQLLMVGAPLQLLKDAVIAANNNIVQQRQEQPKLNRMSCVLSVAILDADKEMMYVAHVGDSRAYVYRNGALLKITKDHSLVGIKEDSGFFTEEQAMHHPRRNEISKMLGEQTLDAADTEAYIEIKEHSFLPGDIALFCTDGLTDLVNQQQIISLLQQELDLQQKVQLLIDKANQLGGKDNITVALADYKAKKSDNKKLYKRAIEVPVKSGEPITEIAVEKTTRRKKKTGWIFIPLALAVGFMANWWGTQSFFSRATMLPDTTSPVKDSTYLPDSLHYKDSLIQAPDTIFKDSTSIEALHY